MQPMLQYKRGGLCIAQGHICEIHFLPRRTHTYSPFSGTSNISSWPLSFYCSHQVWAFKMQGSDFPLCQLPIIRHITTSRCSVSQSDCLWHLQMFPVLKRCCEWQVQMLENTYTVKCKCTLITLSHTADKRVFSSERYLRRRGFLHRRHVVMATGWN